jgi:hypothetical protein
MTQNKIIQVKQSGLPDDLINDPIESDFIKSLNREKKLIVYVREKIGQLLSKPNESESALINVLLSLVLNLENYALICKEKESEPPYHNLEHAREVFTAMLLFFSQEEKNTISKAWPPFNSHEKLLLLIAALGHDFMHPGRKNKFEAEIEEFSAIKIKSIMLDHSVAHSDMDMVYRMILATDAFAVNKNHNLLVDDNTQAILFVERAEIILSEADIFPSLLPVHGLQLGLNLMHELKLTKAKNCYSLANLKFRLSFLKSVRLSSPYSKALNLKEKIDCQVGWLEEEAI